MGIAVVFMVSPLNASERGVHEVNIQVHGVGEIRQKPRRSNRRYPGKP
jgi:hypothetical protein